MKEPKPKADISYVPVQMFIRFSRRENEVNERAVLVARRNDGRQYTFTFEDMAGDLSDLAVCDYKPASDENPQP